MCAAFLKREVTQIPAAICVTSRVMHGRGHCFELITRLA